MPELINRAYSILDIKSFDEDQRLIEGIATTPTPDRIGDIIESDGATFALPMPLLWQHDSRQPVGHVFEAKKTPQGIAFKARMPKVSEPGRLKERLDEVWQSLKHGLVRGVSIGFKPIEMSSLKDGGYRFLKWNWLELSLVTIPANAEANITLIKSVDAESLVASGQGQDGIEDRPHPPGVTGSTKPKTMRAKTMPKTIAEQISAFEATRAAKAARMEELMLASGEEGETLAAEGQADFDTLADEVKAIDAHLKRLDTLEKANKLTLRPAKAGTREEASGSRETDDGVRVQVREERREPGIEFTRYAMLMIAARGNPMQAEQIAKQHYPNERRILNVLKSEISGNPMNGNLLEKAAITGGTTLDATWASPLIDYVNFSGDFIEFLRPQTILGKFGTGNIPSLKRVPFNIQIPAQTSGGAGYWVGEGAAKPLTKFDFTRITMRWAKVANIAVLTDELIRFSSPSAEGLVRESLADALRGRLDTDFVDPAKAAVVNVSPASITNGVTPIASTGATADHVRDDVQAMLRGMITGNIDLTGGVWIMNPRIALGLSLMVNTLGQPEFPGTSMMGGTLSGFPIITSNYVTDVIFALAPEIYLADDGGFTIDASREASLQMDGAPTMNSGTPTAIAVVSMFQTNSLAIRVERYINWQKRRTGVVAYLTNVDWGGSGLGGT